MKPVTPAPGSLRSNFFAPPRVRLAVGWLFALVTSTLLAQSPVAPTIPGTINSQTVLVGDTVQFQVFASGTAPLRYQWKKNGADLVNGGNIRMSENGLQILNAQRSDDALYTCTVSNAAGSVTSNAARLTVRDLRIVTPPANQSVNQGGTATFSVQVSATDPVTYQWWKDGDRVPGATASTLTITNAQPIHVGTYWVQVTSVVNTIGSATATLAVAAAPVITFHPRTSSGIAGSTHVFAVAAIGQGPFTYQWRRNGAPIPGANGPELVIANAQPSDNASYSAVVTNASGSATSNGATLTVFSITISGTLSKIFDGTPLAVTATTNPAGLAVTMQYIRVNGTIVGGPPVNAGFYRAFAVVSDGPYQGSAFVDLRIESVPMTITFSNLQQTYDGKPHPVVAVTNPPGIPLTLEYGGANAGPPVAAGTYTITAYSEDWNYLPRTTQTATLVVAKGNQTVAFGPLPASPVSGTPFTLSATASSGLTPVTFSVVSGNAALNGSTLTLLDGASVTVRATQAGNTNYNAASADFTFSAGKRSQTISFAAIGDQVTTTRTVTLSATATSELPVTFAVLSGPATVSGNTLTLNGDPGTVVIRASQGGDAAFNAAPAVDRSFAVTSQPAPIITTQPVSQTVAIGTRVNFSVQATGTGPLTYQWLKDGRPFGNLSSPTLSFGVSQLADAGVFTVAVSNGAATTMSAGAVLTVNAGSDPSAVAPVITGQPPSQTVAPGAFVSFTVSASGSQQLFYQWRKDGADILGAVGSTLALSDVQTSAAGVYTVVIVNSAGTVTSAPATLTVAAPATSGAPVIVSQPSSTTVTLGVAGMFSVTATGAGPLSYQWRKEGVNIPGATDSMLSVGLTRESDAGSYTVVVSNAAGSVTSNAAILTTMAAPAFTSQPASQTVSAGATVTLSVTVTGTAPLTYRWRKDGEIVPGATGATLVLTNAQPANAGRYWVEVSNAAVSSPLHSNDAVIVVNAPGSPSGTTGSVAVGGSPTPAPTPAPATGTPPAPAPGTTPTPTPTPTPAPAPAPTPTPTPAPTAPVVAGNTPSAPGSTVVAPIPSAPPAPTTGSGASPTGGSAPVAPVATVVGTPSTPTAPTTAAPGGIAPAPASGGIIVAPVASNPPSGSTVGATAPGSTSGGTTTVNPPATTTPPGSVGGPSAPSNGGTVAPPADTGTTPPAVTTTGATGTTAGAATAVNPPAPVPTAATVRKGRLLNLSVRSSAGTGERSLSVGFVSSGTGNKQVVIRAVGPGLERFSLNGTLPDPTLTLFDSGGRTVQGNAGWGGLADLAEVFRRVGAFPLTESSADAAMLSVVGVGANTVRVTSATERTGLTLFEAYDADAADATSRLVNLSARAHVGEGSDALAVGFVIGGDQPVTLLLRGIGPTLSEFGVASSLADPQMTLFDARGVAMAQNNDWSGDEPLRASFARAGAFALRPDSRDAALLVTLPPGLYTAHVTGVAAATGIALVEIYELP